MITDDELALLPDDPELAFVQMESIVRARMREHADQHSWDVEREYVVTVLAFIHENEIKIDVTDMVSRDDDEFRFYFREFH